MYVVKLSAVCKKCAAVMATVATNVHHHKALFTELHIYFNNMAGLCKKLTNFITAL